MAASISIMTDGILAYLKNIRLDESNSDFKLRCSDELKILFDKALRRKKRTLHSKGLSLKKQDANTRAKRQQLFGLGDLQEIIATGNVRILGKNSDGQPFLASGNTLAIMQKTGEMILKGGRPTLQAERQ